MRPGDAGILVNEPPTGGSFLWAKRMADTTNTAEIRVVADASGVEAGLRPAIDAAHRAERAISGIGENSARSQQSLIRAIERTTAQMEAGARTGSRYYEVLARQRGIDPNVLRPYIERMRELEQAQQRAASGASEAAMTIKGAFASALAGLSIVGLAQTVISAQREFDKLNASLVTATGSTEKAAEAFSALQAFAATTPYGVAEATAAFIKMRNLGLDPSERALRSYGNTAAAMGKSLEQMVEAVADASTGEFERLKEFGVKASQDGEKLTLTFKGISTSIKNEASAIEKYLMRIGELDFAGAMLSRAATLDGAISALSDTWDSTMRTISSSGIGQAAQDGVLGLSAALTDLQTILVAISAAADKQSGSLHGVELVHKGLTTAFEAVSILGVNVVYVLTQVGRELAGLAAQATAVARLEFAQARAIGEMMKADAERDRKDVDAKTAAILGAVEQAKKATKATSSTGPGADDLAQFRIQREAERESAEAAKKRADQVKRETAAMAELAGLTSTFASDWKMLSTLYAKGQLSLEGLTKAQANLLAKQPAMKAAADQELAARKAIEDFNKRYMEGLEATSGIYAERIKAATEEAERNEEVARTYGMSAAAIEREEVARLKNQLAQATAEGYQLSEIEHLKEMIQLRERSAAALASVEAKDATQKASEKAATDWKRTAEMIEESLTDALLRGFESGKGFGRNLVDSIKNMFKTLVLQPVISAVVNPVAGAIGGALGLAGTAQAASSGSSALSNATGIMGGIGALSGSFGAGLSSGLSAWAAEGSVMGLLNSGALFGGGIVNGLGAIVGALGPIALGIGAAVAIWKKLDTSGTYHTGGASTATGNVVSATTARSLNMEAIRNSAETQKFTDALALGIVGILDSTATAFGKQAGYTAATAFADDTSKDGAWGSLRITNAAGKVLDWQDTKRGAWAPKTFADGKAGQDQYLAALSQSVRQALDSIGLPSWAKQMLDGLGSGASVEEMAKVVDSITVAQSALKIMGERLVGFASLSESAIGSLMKAAGGIESLAAGASAYYDNFYSESEKAAVAQEQLANALKSVGLAVPKTREEYRALVEQQLALGESGTAAVAKLFQVSGAFAQLNPLLEDAANGARSAASILEERSRLQDEYDELMLTSDQLLAKRRAALDESNRSLFDQIQGARKAKEAQDAAKASLGDFIGQMKSFATSAAGMNSSLMLGSFSILTPEQQYAEARRQFEQTSKKAAAGDATAQGNLSAIEQTFLQLSQKVNGGDAQYASDLAIVMRTNDELAKSAGASVGVAQASLDVLNGQAATLTDIHATLTTIAQGGQLGGPVAQSFAPIDYSRMGTLDMAPLVAEVKALREEVKSLRADQQKQTGDLIQATGVSAREAAETVVEGVSQAVTDGAYASVYSRREIK